MSETELYQILKGCEEGQRREQYQLFQYLSPILMKVCMRYADSKDTAKDYLQESMVKIFKHIHAYQYKGSFDGWAKRVTINTILDILRKKGAVSKTISLEDIKEQHLQELNRGESELNYADAVQFINRLPDAKKIIFNLYAIEGYAHKEIAELLHITEGTSKSQLHKARELLQQMHTKANQKINLNEDVARTN